MGFDMATTIVAFKALFEEDHCCGTPISAGAVSMSITFPFFFLVGTEIALLLRAILLTLFPNMGDIGIDIFDDEGDLIERSTLLRWCCCCLRREIKIIMHILGILVLVNPFFGCVIAWILLYQSDKKDAFIVLGFEGGSLLLHYIAVCLEGSIISLWTFFLHGIVPLVPFAAGVGLTLFYLKQGGVCYLVERQMFNFNGCEICLDGYPPVSGVCHFPNGTTYPYTKHNAILDLVEIRDVNDVLVRTTQVTYCANKNPDGPDMNFCFFDFNDGLLPSVTPDKDSTASV